MEIIKALRITVKDKIATYNQRDGVIVCGNKGYKIAFSFDAEWDAHTTKTARFIWNGKYYDQEFTDDECDVPVINDTAEVTVGVYAGDLKTTTPAKISCLISILCGKPEASPEKIKEYRDEAQQSAEEAKAAAKVVVFPVIDVTNISGGHQLTITDVEGEKRFNVMDGAGALTPEEEALLAKLSAWYDAEHYVRFAISSFNMNPATTTYEMGSSRSVIFSWSFNKLPTAVKFNGEAQNAVQKGSATAMAASSSHSTLSYSLYGKYADNETATAVLSINFRNKYYYGCAAEPTAINSIFINSLSSSGWAHSKTISFTPNCAAGNYVWYAYPTRLGKATMWMGGFQGGFEEPITVTVANGSGYSEPYYVYKSTNSGIGSLAVEAK